MDEFIVVQSSWFCTISREINWPRQYEQLRTSIGAKKQHFGANKLHWGLIWAIDSMVNLTAFCSFFTPALANLNQAKILATFSGHEKNAKTNTSFLFGSEKSLLILCDTLDLDTARKMTGSPGQTRPLMWINMTLSWEKICKLIFFQMSVGIWWHWVSRGHYLLVLGGTGSVLSGTNWYLIVLGR